MQLSGATQVPVNIVGSSVFGRYPKISTERTYNLFQSDDWMVSYAGFQKIFNFSGSGEGRGLFHSVRNKFLIAVVDSSVYKISENLFPEFIGEIESLTGEVVMDENLNDQICITDTQNAYIYNVQSGNLTKQTLIDTNSALPITPQCVTYHNTFFLIASSPHSQNPQNWYAFQRATDDTIEMVTQFSLQTKPDMAVAVKRLPGHGNNIIVFGTTVAEIWTQIGGEENYRRISSFNIDNGAISIYTIAESDQYVVWLSQNATDALSIMLTDGGSTQRISSDGIDIVLENLVRPDKSTAFFYRQDGHLFYQITFFDTRDNLSLIYDFNTQKFYHVTNEKMNFHPARQLVYFNNSTYFLSLNDAAFYEMNSKYVYYNYDTDKDIPGEEIPRKRIVKTIRKKDSLPFRAGLFSFWMEQGVNKYYQMDANNQICEGLLVTESGDYIVTESGANILDEDGFCTESNIQKPRVDLSISKNGNESFGARVGRYLNPEGYYKNRIHWDNLGMANEITLQLEFWGLQRFVLQDGYMEIS